MKLFHPEDVSSYITLKKIFPLSFKYANDVSNLVIGIIIHVVVGVIAGFIIGLATNLVDWLPLVGGVLGMSFGLVGSLVGLYMLAGIVILILAFLKIIK